MGIKERLYNLGKYAAAIALIGAIPSDAYAARRRVLTNYCPAGIEKKEEVKAITSEKKENLEKKIKSYELPWRDKEAQKKYNELAQKVKEVLEKKGKYKEDPREEIPGYFSSESSIKKMEEWLLRESDPEKYLKEKVKDEKEIAKIKAYFPSRKEANFLRGKQHWKVNLDLSDKIYFYETMEGFKKPWVPMIEMHPVF